MEILGQGKFLKLVRSETNGVSREWVPSRGAAAALIVDCYLDQVLLVSQTRPPIHPNLVEELVAGIIDEGESPAETILREIAEETGINEEDIEDIYEIGKFYSSPGLTNEMVHLFVVETFGFDFRSLPSERTHENEKLTLKVLSIDELQSKSFQDWRIEIAKAYL